MTAPDRQVISQLTDGVLGLMVTSGGAPVDASSPVTLTVVNEDTQDALFTRTAVHEGLGQYTVALTSADTQVIANFTALWSYQVDGAPQVQRTFYAIGNPQLLYDGLSPAFKTIVDQLWAMFADQFDSPTGGPNLQTYYQSNWSKSRAAQAMVWGLMELNTIAQPHGFFTIDGVDGPQFPVAQWGGLLLKIGYIQVLKHLQRSYLEQPDFVGGGITRLDRQRYYDRYGQLIASEESSLKRQIDTFKIGQMFLGSPSIVVGGGIFGRSVYSSAAYYAAARPSIWAYGGIA